MSFERSECMIIDWMNEDMLYHKNTKSARLSNLNLVPLPSGIHFTFERLTIFNFRNHHPCFVAKTPTTRVRSVGIFLITS